MPRKEKMPRTIERHHKLPRSRGGTDTFPPGNVVNVEKKLHRAWHSLVGNMEAKEIAAMLTDTWIDPRYYLVAVPRDKIQHKKRRERRYCVRCQCEVLQTIKLKEEDDGETA